MAADRRTGLLVDWGGVLTSDVFASFSAFCDAEGLVAETVRDAFMRDPRAGELLVDLECGRISEEEFEPRFAAVLELAPARAAGLIDRLFGGMAPDAAMIEAVAAFRAAGVRTGLLSNSWGRGRYDRTIFARLFDCVVISGDEGIRKPDPAIYDIATQRIGLPPEACVFVDDLRGNLKPARELGMATVHHVRADDTIAALEDALGLSIG
jgi:epoxide hydrolase-like predicted phosphatase